MALRAPGYGDPNVNPAPFPGARFRGDAPLEAFGGGRARDQVAGMTRGLNADVQQIVEQERQRADFDRMAEERVALNNWELGRVYDRQKGALGKLGKDAMGESEKVFTDMDTFTAERERGLATEDQRRAYRQMVSSRREHIGRTLTSHEGEQRQQIHLGSLKASTASSVERAAADPSTVGLESRVIDDNTRALAQSLGYDEAMTKYARQRAQSDLHTQVIDRMLTSKADIAARDYYNLNGKFIIGQDAERIGRMVKNESTLGEAYRQVDRIFSTYYETVEKPGATEVNAHYAPETEEAAVEEARKITDPDVRAQAERLTRERWHGQARSKEAERKKLLVDAANAIDAGKQFDDLPASLRDSMTASEKKSMRAYATTEPITDDATWYTLKLMGSHEETRQQFLNLNLLDKQYINSLSKTDRHKMMEWQADLREKKEQALKEADGFMTTSGIVNGTIQGKIPEKDHNRFLRVINDQVREWKAEKKTNTIPDREVQDKVDLLLKEYVKPGMFGWTWGPFGTKARAYEERARFSEEVVGNIPKTDRDYIIGQFKERNIVWNDVMIAQAYAALLKQRSELKDNAGK